MADRVKVGFGAVDTAVADVRSGAQLMEQRMQQLQSDIAPMLGSWDGAARESYAAAQAQWQSGWSELQLALAALGVATADVNENYRSTEQAITRSFG
jgi:6 kDa early secretory antigenic target